MKVFFSRYKTDNGSIIIREAFGDGQWFHYTGENNLSFDTYRIYESAPVSLKFLWKAMGGIDLNDLSEELGPEAIKTAGKKCTSWEEVKKAVEDNSDVIFTRNFDKTWANIYYEAAFLPACIYKTKIITDAVAENIYSNVKMIFPHLALISKNINDNNSFYIVSKNIVNIGKNPDQNQSFTRGYDKSDLPPSRKNIFWSVGYFSSLEYIKNKKIRNEITDGTRHYHRSLFRLF